MSRYHHSADDVPDPLAAAVPHQGLVRRDRSDLPLVPHPMHPLTLAIEVHPAVAVGGRAGQDEAVTALNLIRNRKGRLPHIAVVTAEPSPVRISSLALGTGDLDCVYHFALPELNAAVTAVVGEDSQELLAMLVDGRRLKDIAGLPLDLAT